MQANWFDAASICRSFEMKLARFDSDAELTYVAATMEDSYARFTTFWLAGNDITHENNWVWAPDDSPIHLNLTWVNGQDNKNCMTIHGHSKHLLYDEDCSNIHYFLCQK